MASTAPEVSFSASASAASLSGPARLLFLGGTLGAFMDGFHTYGGATSYPSPIAVRMAWWTPALFAGAYLLMGVVYRLNESRQPVRSRALPSAAVFTALYFSSGFLPTSNAVKLAVLVVGALGLFAFGDRSKAAIVTSVVATFIGPSFEIILVHLGLFSHLQPDFLGIPMWLPALYLASGPGLGALVSLVLGSEVPRFLRGARAGSAN